MRIQFLNQHYAPDTASSGQHLTDVAEHLAACGHEVRVLCARGRGADGETPPAQEVRNGVSVRRLRLPDVGGRMAGYATFHAAVAPRVLASRWPELVVSLTTPPMIGAWGGLARRLRGVEHVNYLMDHHPDAEFEAGMIARESWTGRALERIYRRILSSATRNVVLGPHQARRVTERGIPASSTTTIPIWSWATEIRSTPEERARLRNELGWSRFTVLYSGNAGQVHRFDELLGAMERLDRFGSDLHFAFVGGGPRRPEIESFVKERGLANASFHDALARDRVGALLSAADAHFVSLRPEHVGVSVPSKLYGQLASSRPVVFVGPPECETAEDLAASGGGVACDVEDVSGLVETLRMLRSNPARCLRMGKRGRSWFLANREKSVCCRAWGSLVADLERSRGEARDRSPLEAGTCASSR